MVIDEQSATDPEEKLLQFSTGQARKNVVGYITDQAKR